MQRTGNSNMICEGTYTLWGCQALWSTSPGKVDLTKQIIDICGAEEDEEE